MGLLDGRGRPIAATVPAVDEIKLANLVATRCRDWRAEPMGIPRAPEFAYFGRQLGPLTDATRAAISRLWQLERANSVGGAAGLTTMERDEPLDLVERWARRFGK